MSSQQPTCYGRHWDPAATECRGGLDPNYTNPGTGSNRREQCRWYQQCAAATNNARIQAAAQTTAVNPPAMPPPPSIGYRPSAPIPVYAPPPPPVSLPQVAPTAVVVHGQPSQLVPQPQHVTYCGQVPYTQPMYASVPAAVPINQPMPGAATQMFLMVPEPNDPNVAWGLKMWRSTYRAMGKAAMLTIANFLDYYPIGQNPRP